jgi:DNA-binding transcriptional regulator YdaS (Cro superfamily)
MKIEQVIKFYGNEIKAAAEIGVTAPTIKNWEKGIPRLAQLAIETLTKGKLKADKS